MANDKLKQLIPDKRRSVEMSVLWIISFQMIIT